MLARRRLSRKAGFAAALVEAGVSASAFALNVGVSRRMLYRVLNDPKQSAPLTAKIDAFIAEHVGREPIALAS